MKRPLKPNERVALFAASIAILGGQIPLLIRSRDSSDGSIVSGDFISGLLLGLIGVLLVAGVAWWLKRRPAD